MHNIAEVRILAIDKKALLTKFAVDRKGLLDISVRKIWVIQ